MEKPSQQTKTAAYCAESYESPRLWELKSEVSLGLGFSQGRFPRGTPENASLRVSIASSSLAPAHPRASQPSHPASGLTSTASGPGACVDTCLRQPANCTPVLVPGRLSTAKQQKENVLKKGMNSACEHLTEVPGLISSIRSQLLPGKLRGASVHEEVTGGSDHRPAKPCSASGLL